MKISNKQLEKRFEELEESWGKETVDIIRCLKPLNKKEFKTYLITDGIYYKIGRAVDPEKRLMSLSCANPNLECIHVINSNIEYELHQLFKHKIIKGECFALSQEDVEIIKAL